MEETQDWLLCRIHVQCWGPYVQSEAVFALWRTKASSKGIDTILGLGCKAREVDRPRLSLWTVAIGTGLTRNQKTLQFDQHTRPADCRQFFLRPSLGSLNIPSLQRQTIHYYQGVAVMRNEGVPQVVGLKVCPGTLLCCLRLA